MQQKPEDAMDEVEAEAAARPELGFWLAAGRRLAPDDPFFAAGDLKQLSGRRPCDAINPVYPSLSLPESHPPSHRSDLHEVGLPPALAQRGASVAAAAPGTGGGKRCDMVDAQDLFDELPTR